MGICQIILERRFFTRANGKKESADDAFCPNPDLVQDQFRANTTPPPN